MRVHRIKQQDDCWYPRFRAFYAESFPLHEQRNEEQQIYALRDDRYHLDCYIKDDRLLAFIAYWDFRTYYYIDHFAVHPALRGQSVGSTVLTDFVSNTDRLVVLEIDPIVDEISTKRYRFYERLGFVKNPYPHFHPAYDGKSEPYQLIVLTSPRAISSDEYNQFKDDLQNSIE